MPTSLRFQFAAIEAEISAMKLVSRSFMDPASSIVFDAVLSNLRMIRTSGAGRWGANEATPLRTKLSGEYEKGGSVADPVFGELSWVWALTSDKAKRKQSPPETFRVTGIAAVRVRIRRHTDMKVVADWHADFGAVDSPGCYFHSHITEDICVPRVPTLFVTPMDTLEFLLGELFQNSWAEHATSERGDLIYWRSTQLKLLTKVLEWKRKTIVESAGSPWVALKNAKPEEEDRLFWPPR